MKYASALGPQVPTLEEFMAMESGRQPYCCEVFFLGLLGEIDVFLNEAIEGLWKGYRRYGFSNFGMNLLRDSRLTDRAAVTIKKRESEPARSSGG